MLGNLRVGTKIILLVLILVVISVSLESINSQYMNRKIIEQTYSEKLKNSFELQSQNLDKYLEQTERQLKHLANSEYFDGNIKVLTELNEIVNDSTERKAKEYRKWFKDRLFDKFAEIKDFDDIYLLNTEGTVIYKNSDLEYTNVKFHNADNQSVVFQNQSFHINKPVREHQKFFVYYSISILDENNNQQGFILLKEDLKKIVKEFYSSKISNIQGYEYQVFYRLKDEIYKIAETQELSTINSTIPYNEDAPSSPYELATSNNDKKSEGWIPVSVNESGDEKSIYYNTYKKLGVGFISSVNYNEITSSLSTNNIYTWLIAIIIIVLSLILSILFSRIITHPMNRLQKVLALVSNGVLPRKLHTPLKDEVGEMVGIVNKIVASLKSTASFAHRIGAGEFDNSFRPISKKDILGVALVNMRESLQQADIKDELRNWVVTGVAKMGEILRSSSSMEELGDDILNYLSNRINAAQAVMYVTEEDDAGEKFLTIIASYAYQKKKYLKGTIKFAQGLAGQAAVEQNNILRTEIPEDYLKITSGILGDHKPNCILLIPLITNEKVFGVLEFAGFSEFTKGQIEFLDEVSEMIARTIYNMQVNERTRNLLENAQKMSHELQSQQNELKKSANKMEQNQKEIEETNQKLEEQVLNVNNAQKRTQALLENSSEIITIYDQEGVLKYVSPSVSHILGYKEKELVGKNDRYLVDERDQGKVEEMYNTLLDNPKEAHTIEFQYYKKTGAKVWLEATGKNMLKDPAINGIVFNSRDITERRKAEEEERKRGQMQALSENSTDLILRLDKKGNCFYINPTIEKLTNCKAIDILGKNISETVINEEITKSWMEATNSVFEKNTNVTNQVNFPSISGERIMQLNGIPEHDENGNVESTLLVSHDITEQKLIETEIKNTNQKINDSINYAEIIQETILPDNQEIQETFKESFIFFKPRDVVSGDFPWFYTKGDYAYLAAVDCTGHGVPGAMISIVGFFLLNNIISRDETPNAGQLLDELDHLVTSTFNQNEESSKIKDGMDLALCRINLKTNELDYAGANRPLYIVNPKGDLTEVKGDKFPIGGGLAYANKTTFKNNLIELNEGDSVFFFSDGYPDQFGGESETKFGPSRIKSMLTDNYNLPLKEISKITAESFKEWKGKGKQTDDVLLIGIKF